MDRQANMPFRFTNLRQERIYCRLALVGPGPAAFYQDACRLLQQESALNATSLVVSHLFREIESAIRDVLMPMADRSVGAAKKKDDTHSYEIRCILAALEIDETDPIGRTWLSLPGRDNDYGLAKRAHRSSLGPPRPVDSDFRTFVEEFEVVLDDVLDRMERRYSRYIKTLDEILEKPHLREKEIDRLLNEVPNNTGTMTYFFGKLQDGTCLALLRAKGLFDHPPEPELMETTNGVEVRLYPWPQTRYLVRMAQAGHAPETILDIVHGIPPTENIRVHEDLAKIALALPVDLAATMVPMADAWLDAPYASLVPRFLGKLIDRFACKGRPDAALTLTGKLFRLEPSPNGSGFLPSLEPHPVLNHWGYGRLLAEVRPKLVDATGIKALSLLNNQLEEAIRSVSPLLDPEWDYFDVWCPAIEQDSRIELDRSITSLVLAIRDAATQLANEDAATQVPLVVRELRSRPWRIFQRLAMHVVRSFATVAPEPARDAILDRSLFEERRLIREYKLLVKECFGKLSARDQETYLGWIRNGLDRDTLRQQYRQTAADGDLEEDVWIEQRVIDWQWERLVPIRDALTGADALWCEELAARLGRTGDLDFEDTQVVPVAGSGSPLSKAELQAMTDEEITNWLRTWQPSGRIMDPAPEGLSQVLTSLVEEEPDRFGRDAHLFEGLDPTYVQGLVIGLHQALSQGKTFPWPAVLRLCHWVVAQHRDSPTTQEYGLDADHLWSWTRRQIAHLLRSGLQKGEGEVPISERTKVWEILELLTTDPDPTPDYERQYGGGNLNPAELALNTTRPIALDAVVEYAMWVRRHSEESLSRNAQSLRSLVPEAESVLVNHLNPAYDPSVAVRAVYGQRLRILFYLDANWVKGHVSQIFPAAPDLAHLRDAAWESYIMFNHLNDTLFTALANEYEQEIRRLGSPRLRWRWRGARGPQEALAEHVMILYCRGMTPFDQGTLPMLFFEHAPESVRAHAIEFIGQRLKGEAGEVIVVPEILDRLIRLWRYRVSVAESEGLAGFPEELAAFGWWFLSDRFGSVAVPLMARCLNCGKVVEPEEEFVERLSDLASDQPSIAVDMLTAIFEGLRDEWRPCVWKEPAHRVLQTAIQGDDLQARRRAKELLSRLVARGYVDFAELARSIE